MLSAVRSTSLMIVVTVARTHCSPDYFDYGGPEDFGHCPDVYGFVGPDGYGLCRDFHDLEAVALTRILLPSDQPVRISR